MARGNYWLLAGVLAGFTALWPRLDSLNLALADQASSCHALKRSELEMIPGWDHLKRTIQSQFGAFQDYSLEWDGNKNPPQVCSLGNKIRLGVLSDPRCQVVEQSVQGILGVEGAVSASIRTGFDRESTISVTHASEFGSELSVHGEANFVFASVETQASMRYALKNARDSSNTVKIATSVESKVTIVPIVGEHCSLNLTQRHCSSEADGWVPMIAKGRVEFRFENPVQGYDKWYFLLEDVLSDEDRSIEIPLSAAVSTTTYSEYRSDCMCKGSGCHQVDRVLPEQMKSVKKSYQKEKVEEDEDDLVNEPEEAKATESKADTSEKTQTASKEEPSPTSLFSSKDTVVIKAKPRRTLTTSSN